MGERKKRILKAIVDDYIQTAEPVGSRTIAKKNDLNLSSATIRNEMADLEDMGYLDKPHTSAGRIPSSRGYRFYVNSLMRKYDLTSDELEKLKVAMEIRIRELDDLILEASNIVSRLTNYTVIATSPRPKNNYIKNIKLLPIGGGNVLLALVTALGTVSNKVIQVPSNISDEYILEFSDQISQRLIGKSPFDISMELNETLARLSAPYPGLWITILDFLQNSFENNSQKGIYTGGVVNIFNHPEYKNLDKAKEFISFIDSRENIYDVVSEGEDEDISITIGEENNFKALKDCSVVVSHYDVGGSLKGSIGIIGPTRMDYAKVVSSLQAITDKLDAIVYKLFFNG